MSDIFWLSTSTMIYPELRPHRRLVPSAQVIVLAAADSITSGDSDESSVSCQDHNSSFRLTATARRDTIEGIPVIGSLTMFDVTANVEAPFVFRSCSWSAYE